MILKGVMALTLRYFTEFGKPAFQHFASARIELIDQKSAYITHMGWLKIKYPTRQYAISPQPVV